MTKDEVFAYMQQDSEFERGEIGFMIVPLRGYDIERFCDDDVCEKYRKLTPEQRTKFLSDLADDMSKVFENDPDWTAFELLQCARDLIEDEHNVPNGLTWLMDEVKKEDEQQHE